MGGHSLDESASGGRSRTEPRCGMPGKKDLDLYGNNLASDIAQREAQVPPIEARIRYLGPNPNPNPNPDLDPDSPTPNPNPESPTV